MVTAVETSWRLFSCRVPCLWAWPSIPRTPFPPRAGSCCCASSDFQPWARQEGAPSWRLHLGAAAAAPGSGLCRIESSANNGKSSRAVTCPQGNVLPPGTLQFREDSTGSVLRRAPACSPWGQGAPPRAGQQPGAAPAPRNAPKLLQDRTLQGFVPKAKYQEYCTTDLCSW